MNGIGDFPRGFASDNFAGIHPQVLDHLLACRGGHAMAYGDDPITARARAAFNRLFKRPVITHFVFNGTAANNLSLMAFAKPHGAVLCSDVAHILIDESTAPERIMGMRLTPLPTVHGKIQVDALERALGHAHGIHGALPVALTLTQPTELGTVYTRTELQALIRKAKAHGLGVHVDGARLGCAVAALGLPVPELLEGVDVLSFGGTKQGMLLGEAVVFLNPSLGADFLYWQKCHMQLASKMRFVSAQFEGLLEGDLWIENGRQANAMAARLHQAIQELPRIEVAHPVEANAIFVRLPEQVVAPLQAESFFWPWDERERIYRWMCAFDTEASDIVRFTERCRALLT
jgi:threonine aldolase